MFKWSIKKALEYDKSNVADFSELVKQLRKAFYELKEDGEIKVVVPF